MATQFANSENWPDNLPDNLDVETLLGIHAGKRGRWLRLASSIEEGLPVAALDRVADAVAPEDAQFKFRLIPKATLERRRKSAARRLTDDEGDQLARIAKVFVFAADVYKGDVVRAREFLNRPHPMLEQRTPLDLTIGSGPGADIVINILGRAAYGGGV